jgi:hypothetical protein
MIPLDILRAVRTIVTHARCPDGRASAILLHDALPEAEVLELQHGTRQHRELQARPGMLFCDFSPHPDAAPAFAAAGTIVLDHHRTARSIVEACGGVFGDEDADPGVSGAVLAYRHVWLPLRGADVLRPFAEDVATLTGIRDTWQRSHPRWREACALALAIQFLPSWDAWPLAELEQKRADLRWLGEVLLAREEARIQRAVAEAYRFTTAQGLRVLVVQGLSVASDAADQATDVDVIAAFSYAIEDGEPKLKLSLRSPGSFDCASFAQAFGGGGHTHAAGMSAPVTAAMPNPFAFIEGLFAAPSLA